MLKYVALFLLIINSALAQYTNISISGTFNSWNLNSHKLQQSSTNSNYWTIDIPFQFISPRGDIIYFKFNTGTWNQNWGSNINTSSTKKTVPFGQNLFEKCEVDGIYRITFNTSTLDYTFERRSFASFNDYRDTFYKVFGWWDDEDTVANDFPPNGDRDVDGLTNQKEFEFNSDPFNSDTDRDTIADGPENDGVAYSYDSNFNPIIAYINPSKRDTDDDYLTDLFEFWVFNTNPAEYNSFSDAQKAFQFNSIYGTNISVTIASNINNFNYKIESDKSNLMKSLSGPMPSSVENINNSVSAKYGLIIFNKNNSSTISFRFGEDGSGADNKFQMGKTISANSFEFGSPFNFTLSSLNNIKYIYIEIDFVTKALIYRPMNTADLDQDGLSDEYEKFYGLYLNPVIVNLDPNLDYDNDGKSVSQEYLDGTNPVLDTNPPVISLIGDSVIFLNLPDDAQAYFVDTIPDPGILINEPNLANQYKVLYQQYVGTNGSLPEGVGYIKYVVEDTYGNISEIRRWYIIGNIFSPNTYFGENNLTGMEVFLCGLKSPLNTKSSSSSFESIASVFIKDYTEGNKSDARVTCWIGINTNNIHPKLWSEDSWQQADLVTNSISGPSDLYKVNFTNLVNNTYYVASRVKVNQNTNYFYGGIDSEFQSGPWGIMRGYDRNGVTMGKTFGNGILVIKNR